MSCKKVFPWLIVALLVLLNLMQYALNRSDLPSPAVPDEATAIKIADAVLQSVYGDDMEREKPLLAEFDGDTGTWIVTGSLPEGHLGGVAEIRILKKDGRILKIEHGM